jgi:ribosomal-protein-alanine N-acetyltransferase
MGFHIEFCSRREVRAYYLETNASNQAAIDLYRSFSYRVIGVRPKYYREKEDALLMARRA